MVQEARIDRLLKLVPFAGTVLYSCFTSIHGTNIKIPSTQNWEISWREIVLFEQLTLPSICTRYGGSVIKPSSH